MMPEKRMTKLIMLSVSDLFCFVNTFGFLFFNLISGYAYKGAAIGKTAYLSYDSSHLCKIL